MFPQSKYIYKILLVALWAISSTSCTHWHDAKAVVVEADRLLVHHKIITRDTAALNSAIDILDGPLGHIFARDELAKAYYFMGRNFYYVNDFAIAAEYYILCDRMNPSDPMYKGRINSCMGFICKQDSCFAEALEFYERANIAFEKTGDKRRVANGLVSIAEQYVNLKDYAKADSVLKIAAGYDIDSAYYADIIDIKAMALYNQQLYDSALFMLLSIRDYPRNIDARCYSYMKIMQIYVHQNNYTLATRYANFIIANTLNPTYRTNAYYVLLKEAEINHNPIELAKYSYLRKDEDTKIHNNSELYAKAADKLKIYLENPHPYVLINWCIFGGMVAILLLCITAYTLHKNKQCASRKTAEVLRLQEEKNTADRKLFERQIFDHSVHFLSKSIWKDNCKLREKANIYCGNIFYRLEDTYHLSEQEIKICLMVLLEFSREQMASYLYVQPNTISKAKNKMAKQLGTSSAQLREFLITILA